MIGSAPGPYCAAEPYRDCPALRKFPDPLGTNLFGHRGSTRQPRALIRANHIVATATIALLFGCYTYHKAEPSEQTVTRAHSGPIEVTRTDHSLLRMRGASIVGDSLVGTTEDVSPVRIAVATKDIQSVVVRQLNVGRTVALGGGLTLAAFAALIVVAVAALIVAAAGALVSSY